MKKIFVTLVLACIFSTSSYAQQTPSNEQIIQLLQQKAANGDISAQNKLKQINQLVLTKVNEKAKQGDPMSIAFLASTYLEGSYGVEPNLENAFKLMKEAADKNVPIAQDTVGLMYNNGMGTSRNDKEALRYFQMAANNGWATSYLNLGLMHYNGEGTTRNFDEAVKYMQEGANKGDNKAQLFIANLEKQKMNYEAETNNPKRQEKAELQKLMNLANFGYPDKQYELAIQLLPMTIMDKSFYDNVHNLLQQAALKNHRKAKALLLEMDNDNGDKSYLKHAFGTDVNLKKLDLPNYGTK